MEKSLREQFTNEGYIIIDVLSNKEINELRIFLDKLLSPNTTAAGASFHSSSFQHLGNNIADFGKEAKQYYFNLLTTPDTEPLHPAFHHPVILKTVEELIGSDLVIDNAAIMAANVGTSYSLGWHRDVIQIPEDEINDSLFSPNRFHNSVQINLPLIEESSLWIVPGSHNRPNTKEENYVFEGSKHYSPEGVDMPGGIPVKVRAGQAVLYNNNLIHRGYTETMKVPRRTLHMGYHSASKPPTWHFYGINTELLNEDYLATLSPTMRLMMEKHLENRLKYPEISATWGNTMN